MSSEIIAFRPATPLRHRLSHQARRVVRAARLSAELLGWLTVAGLIIGAAT
jgi:hypothetical protein